MQGSRVWPFSCIPTATDAISWHWSLWEATDNKHRPSVDALLRTYTTKLRRGCYDNTWRKQERNRSEVSFFVLLGNTKTSRSAARTESRESDAPAAAPSNKARQRKPSKTMKTVEASEQCHGTCPLNVYSSGSALHFHPLFYFTGN